MKRLAVVLAALIAVIAAAVGVSTTVAAPAGAASSWGRVSAPDQTIKAGCHGYRFHYDVTAPGDAWMAEFTLLNPNGRKVSSHTFESAAEKPSGTSTFDLCTDLTIPGRYQIKMKVTSYDYRAASTQQGQPDAFRLKARR